MQNLIPSIKKIAVTTIGGDWLNLLPNIVVKLLLVVVLQHTCPHIVTIAA